MSRRNLNGKRFRLNVDFTEKEKSELLELTNLSEANGMSDAIRRSLRAYRALVDCRLSGGRIVLEGRDGSERELLLGF